MGLFGDTQYQVRAVTRAGRGKITIGGIGMLATNIQIQFQQQPELRPLADGRVFGTVSMPQGMLQVGAVAGPGATQLVQTASSLSNLLHGSGGELVIDMSDPTMVVHEEETDLNADLEFTISQYIVQSYQVTSQTEQPPIMTQVQLFFLDMDDTSSTTTSL